MKDDVEGMSMSKMKLLYAGTSPYARKARMVVLEKGMTDEVEMVFCNPFDMPEQIRAANPLGKVPALIDRGRAIYDSPVICEYLDRAGGGPELLPSGGDARWEVLCRQALADGMLDAAYNIVMEKRREDSEQSAYWIERWWSGIFSAFDALQQDAAALEGRVDLGTIAVGAAIGYIDFRLPGSDWQQDRADLARWYEGFAARPAMKETDPAL